MKKGQIHIAYGPMFSGKTSWLIENINRLDPKKTLTINFSQDNRYRKNAISTHDGKSHEAIPSKDTTAIKDHFYSKNPKYIAIDEIQFFDVGIVKFIEELRNKNLEIYVAGLNFDYLKKKWQNTQKLIKLADKSFSLMAQCSICHKKNAIYSKRLKNLDERIVIGGEELYEPRCKEHFD